MDEAGLATFWTPKHSCGDERGRCIVMYRDENTLSFYVKCNRIARKCEGRLMYSTHTHPLPRVTLYLWHKILYITILYFLEDILYLKQANNQLQEPWRTCYHQKLVLAGFFVIFVLGFLTVYLFFSQNRPQRPFSTVQRVPLKCSECKSRFPPSLGT